MAEKIGNGLELVSLATHEKLFKETLAHAKALLHRCAQVEKQLEILEKGIPRLTQLKDTNPKAKADLQKALETITKHRRFLDTHRRERVLADKLIATVGKDRKTQAAAIDAFRKAGGHKLLAHLSAMSNALNKLALGVTAYKSYKDSPCVTQEGKVIHAGLSALASYGLGEANPVVAAVDAFLPEDYKISSIYNGTAAAVASLHEAATTGNTRAIDNYVKQLLGGQYGVVMREAARFGDCLGDTAYALQAAASGDPGPLEQVRKKLETGAYGGTLREASLFGNYLGDLAHAIDRARAGDTSMMEKINTKLQRGEYGAILKEAADAGNYWASKGVKKGLKEFGQAVHMAFDWTDRIKLRGIRR